MSTIIRTGSIAEAVAVSQQLPEFIDPYPSAAYHSRFVGVKHLVLIVEVDGQIAGFKVGYERAGYWYSWLGGVLPAFRRRGLALALAEAQEKWVQQQGYPHVTFKTLNRHRNMLLFAIGRGFQIIGYEERADIAESRIWLRKWLVV